jgi:hypothetical protein
VPVGGSGEMDNLTKSQDYSKRHSKRSWHTQGSTGLRLWLVSCVTLVDPRDEPANSRNAGLQTQYVLIYDKSTLSPALWRNGKA